MHMVEADFIATLTVLCYRCHQKRAAGGQCSTLNRTLPVCAPAAASLTGVEVSAHLFEESDDHGFLMITGQRSMLTLLQTQQCLVNVSSHSQNLNKIHIFCHTAKQNVKY